MCGKFALYVEISRVPIFRMKPGALYIEVNSWYCRPATEWVVYRQKVYISFMAF